MSKEEAPDWAYKTDWELLREQKEFLVTILHEDEGLDGYERDYVEGLIALLDTIQDWAHGDLRLEGVYK